jgi:hypothetical protein
MEATPGPLSPNPQQISPAQKPSPATAHIPVAITTLSSPTNAPQQPISQKLAPLQSTSSDSSGKVADVAQHTLTPTSAIQPVRPIAASSHTISLAETFRFPEDKYLTILKQARTGEITADECRDSIRFAVGESDITSALMLCEKAIEMYTKLDQKEEVIKLRRYTIDLISQISEHPLENFDRVLAPREHSALGTYIPHLDTGSLRFGTIHGEKRKYASEQGKQRECCHFDFHIRQMTRNKLEETFSFTSQKDKKALENLAGEEKKINEAIDGVDLDSPECQEALPILYSKLKEVQQQQQQLKSSIFLNNLSQNLRTISEGLDPKYSAITCRFEDIAYPLFQNGCYQQDSTFTLTKSDSGPPVQRLVVECEGIGKVQLGVDKKSTCSYTSVSVELDDPSSHGNVQDMHCMLSALGLGTILAKANPSDTARMITITDFGAQVRACGGVGLAAHVIGGSDDTELIDNVCKICAQGSLSTEDRVQRGILQEGASPREDFTSGGADCSFSRLITKGNIEKSLKITKLASPIGEFQILFDVDSLGTLGSYGYDHDSWGTRNPSDSSYKQRQSLLDLVKDLPDDECRNEVRIWMSSQPYCNKASLCRKPCVVE